MLALESFFPPNEQRPTCVLFYHLHCRVFPVKASLLRSTTTYTTTEEIRIHAKFLFQPSMELGSLYLHFIRFYPNEMTVSPQRADDEVPSATVHELVRRGLNTGAYSCFTRGPTPAVKLASMERKLQAE